MNLIQIQLAEAEARRFLAAVETLKANHEAEGVAYRKREQEAKKKGANYQGWVGYWRADTTSGMVKENGAVKRASMDLSRALADLRGRNKRRAP